MGLDIVVYKKLKKVENPVLDEHGYPIDYENQWKSGPNLECSEPYFPGIAKGIQDTVYTWDEVYCFRAGSYSCYNMWREELLNFSNGQYFKELILFSDSEGVIGPIVSEKLYNEFKINYLRAIEYSEKLKDGEYWLSKYKEWMKAFEMASENGAVIFC